MQEGNDERNQSDCFSVSGQVILPSGYYALFRVTLQAHELKGTYDEAIRITSDYEVRGNY